MNPNTALKPGHFNNTALGTVQYSSPAGPSKASTNPNKNVNPDPNLLTQGQAYMGGIVNFDTATGKALAKGATTLKTPQSTTTLSSDKSSDIATNNNNLTNFSNKGVTTDPNSGIATNADGSPYTPPATPEVKPDPYSTVNEDAKLEENFAQMKANTDAVTAAQIASIQERYKRLKEEQAKVNASTLGATTNALIQSGAAKHDVFSDDNIKLRIEQNTNKIKDLEAEENDLINVAKAAQLAGNNRILEQKNTQIEATRKAKQDAAAKLNEELIEANKKARERKEEVERDTAVADLYTGGITDVPSILSKLKKAGYSMTSKEVADTLKNIIPAGLDDLVKTLRTNGAPADVIQNVLSSPDINSAYKNAGSWGAGGTGIVGEYNLYKAQAEQAGQIPMSFNDYQNVDANRKKSIAAAGIASQYGLDKEQRNRVAGLLDDYDKQAKDMKTVLSQSSQIDALSTLALSSNKDKGSRAAAQIGTIFSFMKMLDPTSTVREGEYATAQNTAGIDDKIRNAYNKALDGSFLTDGQVKGYVSTGKALAESNRRRLEDLDKEFDRRSAIFGIPSGIISKTASQTTNETITKVEVNEEQALKDYLTANPTKQGKVNALIQKMEDILGRPINASEFLEEYPEYR